MAQTAAVARNRRDRRHPELIGLTEVAELCDVNYRTVRRWIQSGRLKAVRVGPRLLKVKASDIDAMLRPVGDGAA